MCTLFPISIRVIPIFCSLNLCILLCCFAGVEESEIRTSPYMPLAQHIGFFYWVQLWTHITHPCTPHSTLTPHTHTYVRVRTHAKKNRRLSSLRYAESAQYHTECVHMRVPNFLYLYMYFSNFAPFPLLCVPYFPYFAPFTLVFSYVVLQAVMVVK